jgi:DNA-binding SARP family transcriptional activator
MTDLYSHHQIGGRLRLTHRGWRILTLLLTTRFVRMEAIAEALWPNKKVMPKSSALAIYVAICKLRKASGITIHNANREGWFIKSPEREQLLAGFLNEAETGVPFNPKELK